MFAVAHPNIVPVHYACETVQKVCLAMPYYRRGSLSDRISTGPLRLQEMLRLGQAVLSGLARIHAKSFLHLDLKPSNMLFSNTGAALVADFGQARSIDANGVVRGPRVYKLAFPPEVLSTGIALVESDIYQVGLLLYRAANGEPFYAAQIPSPPDLERQILRGRFPRRDEFMPHVPRRIRTIIRKALRVDPAERYHSSSEMADELAKVMVTNDWVSSSLSVGTLRWEAIRQERPGLLIEVGCTNSQYSVSVFTTRGSERRAKGRSTFWGKFSSRAEADAHLNWVFQQLE